MSNKQLLPNQHTPLHFIYGKDDCCLCRAQSRIAELEREVQLLKEKQVDTPKEGDAPCSSKT